MIPYFKNDVHSSNVELNGFYTPTKSTWSCMWFTACHRPYRCAVLFHQYNSALEHVHLGPLQYRKSIQSCNSSYFYPLYNKTSKWSCNFCTIRPHLMYVLWCIHSIGLLHNALWRCGRGSVNTARQMLYAVTNVNAVYYHVIAWYFMNNISIVGHALVFLTYQWLW